MFSNCKLVAITFLIAGFLCGFVAYGLVVVNSSPYYLENLRINFRANQQLLSIKSTNNDDMVSMLVHRQNVVDSYSNETISIFETKLSGFDFWLPFQLLALNSVTDSMVDTKSGTISEGLERGKLAYTMDLIGLQDHAEKEWDLASKLAGYSSKPEEFKRLIKKLIETELSTLQQ
jgi:hypothetical protein